MKSRILKFTYVMNHVKNCVENHVKISRYVENHVENFKVC